MVSPGRYSAKVKDYGVQFTQQGKTDLVVVFTFKDQEGRQQELYWHGYPEGSDAAKRIALTALLNCGLKGDNLGGFEKGAESGLLDLDQEIEIVVEHQEYNGKTTARVAWVNRAGGTSFKKVSPDAVKKLTGLNLKGEIAALRKETGIEKPEEKLPF